MDDLINNERLLHLVALQVFEKYDLDKNGFWDVSELDKFFIDMGSSFGIDITKVEVDIILREFDRNKDGKLSFMEINKMLVEGLKRLIEEGKLSPE